MEKHRETYDQYLASMGLVKGSEEEIALLQKVFGIIFEEEGPEAGHDHGCSCGGHCGCHGQEGHWDPESQEDWSWNNGEELDEMEEMSDDEVMEALKAYLEAHPEDRPKA